jgi:uncharacterized protein (TIGR02594 family)
MKYILGTIVLILATACTSPGYTIENNTIRKTINLGPINPVYLAVQYNGMHERTDRAELKELLDVDPVRTEWCAAFINAVLEESNIESNNAEHEYPLLARSFLDWGQGISKEDIKPGDLVVFPRGNQGWQGHVGFYLKTQEIDGVEYYYILGGNQDNKVSIKSYRASKALGIRRQPSIKRLTIFN